MEITTQTRIGKLTCLDADYITDDNQRRMALVLCDCGKRKVVRLDNLKQGRTTSCGLCTKQGGVRPHPYKSRRVTKPSSRAKTVTTAKVTGIGRTTDA